MPVPGLPANERRRKWVTKSKGFVGEPDTSAGLQGCAIWQRQGGPRIHIDICFLPADGHDRSDPKIAAQYLSRRNPKHGQELESNLRLDCDVCAQLNGAKLAQRSRDRSCPTGITSVVIL